MNATLDVENPPADWCALRVWAASVRARFTDGRRDMALALISTLNAQDMLRRAMPREAEKLGVMAREIARKIVENPQAT